MKYRYIFVPAFDDKVVGANEDEVVEGWKDDFESNPGIILDFATNTFLDSIAPEVWQDITLERR